MGKTLGHEIIPGSERGMHYLKFYPQMKLRKQFLII